MIDLKVDKEVTVSFSNQIKKFCEELEVICDVVVKRGWFKNKIYIILIGKECDVEKVKNKLYESSM